MSHRSSFASIIAGLAFICVLTGCSSRSASIVGPPAGAQRPGSANPMTRTWVTEAPMPTPRRFLGAAAIRGGAGFIIYAVGGAVRNGDMDTLEAYNPKTNTWAIKKPMPTPRRHIGVGVLNGEMYVVGGENRTQALTNVEVYNPASNTWTTSAPLLVAQNSPAVAVDNGILYAIGGDDGKGHFLNTVEAYNPTTNRWKTVAPLPMAESGMAATTVTGIVYAVGGQNGVDLATNDAYDPGTNTWTVEPPMLVPTSYLGAVPFGAPYSSGTVRLWTVGGKSNGEALSTVENYEPATITWTENSTTMPTPRYGLATVVAIVHADPTLFAIGGYNGTDLNTVEGLRLFQ